MPNPRSAKRAKRKNDASLGMTSGIFRGTVSGFVDREIELHELALEAFRFYRAVDNANRHPNSARELGLPAQMQPDEKTNEKAEQGRNEIGPEFPFFAEVVARECRRVHAHERDERAEIEHFGAERITDGESAGERERADEEHVVARDVILWLDGAEKRARHRVAPAHAVEKARGAKLRAHARTDIGDEQR